MDAALTAILTQLALHIGEDFAAFIGAFIADIVALRKARADKAMILPQLIHWWCVAADEQLNPDGSAMTNEQKHAYVIGIIRVWAKGLGLDLSQSFQDALVKAEMMKRLQEVGGAAVQVIADQAGKAVQQKVNQAMGVK